MPTPFVDPAFVENLQLIVPVTYGNIFVPAINKDFLHSNTLLYVGENYFLYLFLLFYFSDSYVVTNFWVRNKIGRTKPIYHLYKVYEYFSFTNVFFNSIYTK